MPSLFVIGRIAFVLIFILSGALKLTNIDATAAFISTKITLPAMILPWAQQVADATGKSIPQLLAIVFGVIEVVGGLMIAGNFGTRFASFVLIVYTAITTFYFNDIAAVGSDLRSDNTTQVLRNVSMIGALLVFFVLGSWRPIVVRQEDVDNPGQMRY